MPPKPKPKPKPIPELLRTSAFSFVGTVEKLGAATMDDVPVDGRTAIVHVEQVLHAPETFSQLADSRVTLQLAARGTLPRVGSRAAFFANAFAFGESVALAEVGRLPARAVQPQLSAATAAGGGPPFLAFQQQLEADRLREHASTADAVVVGIVTKLEQVPTNDLSEHGRQPWKATLDVDHVEKGRGKAKRGSLDVLYANSLDVRWRDAPKPKAGQSGLWILHATKAPDKEAAPFELLHPEDFQPVQSLDDLRGSPER
jgi:hypothetical protein